MIWRIYKTLTNIFEIGSGKRFAKVIFNVLLTIGLSVAEYFLIDGVLTYQSYADGFTDVQSFINDASMSLFCLCCAILIGIILLVELILDVLFIIAGSRGLKLPETKSYNVMTILFSMVSICAIVASVLLAIM